MSDNSKPAPMLSVQEAAILIGMSENWLRHRTQRGDFDDVVFHMPGGSLRYDREVKLPRYARAGIVEYWIADLETERIEVHREPEGESYARRFLAGRGDTISPLAFPDFEVRVEDLLP